MVDSVDSVDDVDAEKDHLQGCVHFVHNVHLVHCLDKPNWLQLPNLARQRYVCGSFSRVKQLLAVT